MKKTPLFVTLLVLALMYSLAANASFWGKNRDLVEENRHLQSEYQKGMDTMLLVNAQVASFERKNIKACGLYRQAVDKHVEIDEESAAQLEQVCAKALPR